MTQFFVAGAFAVFFAVVPYAVLTGEGRRRHALLDACFYGIALAIFLMAPLFGIRVAPSLGTSLFIAARIVMLFGVASTSPPESLRWSADVAALFAGAVYLMLVPHVLQWPVDGDEPYYALMAQSIVQDGDLDLSNQYRDIASSPIGRPDLKPQFGDPTGPRGQQYSRHEPLLALLLAPGVALAGLPGAVATIALFGALLVRSTMLLLAESGAGMQARVRLFPFLALGPPVIFYATRLWPEVPAAFLFAEALRAAQRLTRSGDEELTERRRLAGRNAAVAAADSLGSDEKDEERRRLAGRNAAVAAADSPGSDEKDEERRRLAGRNAAVPAADLHGSDTADWLSLALAGVLLSLLKLRFLAVAAVLFGLVLLLAPEVPARRVRHALILFVAAVLPFLILFLVSGSPLNIHQLSELTPREPLQYLSGFFGLLLDGAGGLLFQAPLFLFALFFVLRWRDMPPVFRIGVASSAVYLLLLFPRAEWYGGWSPPLRYVVVFIPVLALGAVRILERPGRLGGVVLLSLWTTGLVVHGLAFPWRLFHLANGENAMGEWLSRIDLVDYSRLMPSFVRVNAAAIVWSGALVLAVAVALVWRGPHHRLAIPPAVSGGAAALAIAMFFSLGRIPPGAVELEGSAVGHLGGVLVPDQWTVMRYLYRCGWQVSTGDSMLFRYRGGPSRLWYSTREPAVLRINGSQVRIASTAGQWRPVKLNVPAGVVKIEILSGLLSVDRIERE